MEPKFVCDGKNAQGNLASKFSDYTSMPSEPTNRDKWDQLLGSVGCLASIVEHPLDARSQVTVQQNVDSLSFAKAALEKIHTDYARWLDRTSLKILGAPPCPGEPAADSIFVGDRDETSESTSKRIKAHWEVRPPVSSMACHGERVWSRSTMRLNLKPVSATPTVAAGNGVPQRSSSSSLTQEMMFGASTALW